MTPAVDNTLPSAYNYPIVKSKKEMIIEGKISILNNYINFVTFQNDAMKLRKPIESFWRE